MFVIALAWCGSERSYIFIKQLSDELFLGHRFFYTCVVSRKIMEKEVLKTGFVELDKALDGGLKMSGTAIINFC